jgi:hypothetical protein
LSYFVNIDISSLQICGKPPSCGTPGVTQSTRPRRVCQQVSKGRYRIDVEVFEENCCSTNPEHMMDISSRFTRLEPYLASFEESLSAKNYKPATVENYRYLLRRFGQLLEDEGVA